MTWRHPLLGEVRPIPEGKQPTKVWRHLYSPIEAWDLLVGVPIAPLVDQARRRGCPEWKAGSWDAAFPGTCRPTMREHHDAHWAPGYGPCLVHPETRCGRSRRDGRLVLLAPRGVYFVLQPSGKVHQVVTVFRPHPPGGRVGWSESDFSRHAEDRWNKEIGLPATALLAELHRVAVGPATSASEAWFLALAVGRARASGDPAVAAVLPAAERALLATTPTILTCLPLDGPVALTRLEAALRQEDGDDAVDALLGLEDLLVIAPVLGQAADAERWLDEATRLLDWAPEGWSGLVPLAAGRREEAAALGSQLWEIAECAFVGATMRDAEPVCRPEPRLVDALVPLPTVWRLAAPSLREALAKVGRWLTEAASLEWGLGPRVALRSSPDVFPSKEHWRVAPPPAVQRLPNVRLFVIDAENPRGMELTEHLGGAVWLLEQPGQAASFVWITAPTPIAGATLTEVLDTASRMSGASASYLSVSRPT